MRYIVAEPLICKEQLDERIARGLKEVAAQRKILQILRRVNKAKGPEAAQRVIGSAAVLYGVADAVTRR